MRLYTLGSRESRELKTFLEICLISSRIDQKLRNKERIHQYLKRIFARNLWPFDAVVGADLCSRGSSSTWRLCGSKFGAEWGTIVPCSNDDWAMIARRSWFFVNLYPLSDEEPLMTISSIVCSRQIQRRSSDEDRTILVHPRVAR